MTEPVLDSPALRKARGAFFTPPELTEFLANWAVRTVGDRVLEPSCGEAAFLVAACQRLQRLGCSSITESQLHGIEIHEDSARTARHRLHDLGVSASIRVGDFFEDREHDAYDACLGNPPYVRYQNFGGAARTKSREIALIHGVRLTGLASAWAAFVIHASQLLKPDGRLGLVLPAELLSVNYAAEVRRFLLHRFRKVRLVVFEERVFPGVLEEVVLLLAEGTGPTDHFELMQVRDLAGLQNLESVPSVWSPVDAEGKWTPALLPARVTEAITEAAELDGFGTLEQWGKATLGMVTGNNKYFTLSPSDAAKLKIGERDLLEISPPGSRHLRGLTFTDRAWDELARENRAVYLVYPRSDRPSGAIARYLEVGEEQGVQAAYKCRVRSPWWRVPLVPAPDLFFTYMNHDTARLVSNRARVRHLNSVHGVKIRKPYRKLGTDLLPMASLNSITLLGAEMVGRSYGGGILKLEPREADSLPLPNPSLVEAVAGELRALRPQLAGALRNGDLMRVVALVDRVLLTKAMGLRRKHVEALREGRAFYFDRRQARTAK